MLYTLFIESESILTYFFIIATVTFAYDKVTSAGKKWLHLAIASLIFGLIFKPIELYFAKYYLYIIITLLGAFLYCLIFLRKSLKVSTILLLYLMYSVVAAKTLVINIISPIVRDEGDSLDRVLIRVCLYGVFMILFCYYRSFYINPKYHMPLQFWVFFLLSPLLIVVCIETLSYISQTGFSRYYLLPISVALFASLLLTYYLCYCLMQAYESKFDSQFSSQKLALQLEHAKHSTAVIEQIRKEKHEIKNNYFYIQTLLDTKKYDELSEFLKKELGPRLDLTEEFHTGNQMADYILTQKVSEARADSINVMTNAMLPSQLPITDEELCALLMNLLDNAIEASLRENTDVRDIHIKLKIVSNQFSLQIKNYCSTDVLAQNPGLATLKKNKITHGIGLSIVNQIVVKYHGIFETYMESDYFTAAVLIPLQSTSAQPALF